MLESDNHLFAKQFFLAPCSGPAESRASRQLPDWIVFYIGSLVLRVEPAESCVY